MFYMHGFGWGWWLIMSVGMVAFWALVIYGIVLLVRGQRPDRREEPPAETPQQILKRRLAAGEITLDEYEHLREALEDRQHRREAA